MLAALIGAAIIAPVAAGTLPAGFSQLAALSASTAGIALAWIEGRGGAVRELLSRGLRWRVGASWWLVALLLPAIPPVVSLYLATPFTQHAVSWSGVQPLYTVIPSLVLLIVFAGIGEEFGWRGFAIPRVESKHTALMACLIIGSFHALWHLPLFFIKGEMYQTLAAQIGIVPAFLGYAALVLGLTVQLAWIFNNTGGSVLLAAVYHGAGNAWAGYVDVYRGQLANAVAFMGAQVLLGLVLLVVFGPARLRRGTATA